MIARPGTLDPGPAADDGANAPSMRDRLRAARLASRALHRDTTDWLQLQREALQVRAGTLLWRAFGVVCIVCVGLTCLVTATALVLTGAASWIGASWGQAAGAGGVVVGGAVLLLCVLLVAVGRRDRGAAERRERALEQCAAARLHARQLVRAIGLWPGMALSAGCGFVLVRLLRHRPLRRAVLLGIGAMRRLERGAGATRDANPAHEPSPVGSERSA